MVNFEKKMEKYIKLKGEREKILERLQKFQKLKGSIENPEWGDTSYGQVWIKDCENRSSGCCDLNSSEVKFIINHIVCNLGAEVAYINRQIESLGKD